MNKIRAFIVALFAVAIVMCFLLPTPATAANDVVIVGNATAIAYEWTACYVDTFSLVISDGLTKLKFSTYLYNTYVTSLNAATDSGYAIVKGVGNIFGVENSNTVAQGLFEHTVGDNSEADTIKWYMGIKEIWITPQNGDSSETDDTVLIYIRGMRK